MKKIFSLMLAAFLFMGVNANAKELKKTDLSSKQDITKVKIAKKSSKAFVEIDDEVKNYQVDLSSVTSTSFIKVGTIVDVDGDTTTYKQYFVAQNGNWVHTKTDSILEYVYDGIKYKITGLETFYTDSNNPNCSSVEIDPNDVTKDSCIVINQGEPATKQVITKWYESNKLWGDTSITFTKTNRAVTYLDKNYHSNGKVSYREYLIYNTNGYLNTSKSYIKAYDTKGRILEKLTFYANGNPIFHKSYSYHSNNKVKKFKIVKFKSNGNVIYDKKTTYTNKSKKVFHQNAKFNSKGYATTVLQYKYNKKGTLKSSKKSGSAYRTKRVVSNGKITKSYKAKYNSKGKLQKAKKIKTKKKNISYYTSYAK